MKINTKFLYYIFNELQKLELDTLQHISKKRNHFKLRKPYENNYEKLTDLLHNSPILNLKTENKINFNSVGWETRYYQICFGISTKKEIDEVCHNYIEGLSWILEYYFKKCKSWEWTYKYRHAPLLKDLANYVKSHDNINKVIRIPSGNPNKPFQQLLSVLPYQSRGLLPASYQVLMTSLNSSIKQYYPIDYEIDTIFKRYFWQCQPMLPVIVNKKIRNSSNSCKLSIDEKKRNSFEENILLERKIKHI